tara:strand:- start:389 stop:1063 length:675 start_codon:yes stop_codon:yes gene_type:complete
MSLLKKIKKLSSKYSSPFGGFDALSDRRFAKAYKSTLEKAAKKYEKKGYKITGYDTISRSRMAGAPRSGNRRRETTRYRVPIYGISKKKFLADQKKFKKQYQETAEKSQADIAKQLRILQGERSAISQLKRDYADMLKKEAAAKEAAQRQAREELKVQTANQAFANRAANFQIEPAAQGSTRLGGTQQFRRRFGASAIGTQAYGGLGGIRRQSQNSNTAGVVNI